METGFLLWTVCADLPFHHSFFLLVEWNSGHKKEFSLKVGFYGAGSPSARTKAVGARVERRAV
jgi:hypothetical protein